MHTTSQNTASQDAEVQAAFCIDVRSEPVRRALETVQPAVQSIGFADLFGLPATYTPMATQARQPQLPGLLAPSIGVTDRVVSSVNVEEGADAALQSNSHLVRLDHFGFIDQWLAASRWPGATFSFVEGADIGRHGKLGRWLRPAKSARERDNLDGLPGRYRSFCRPQITGQRINAKVSLAAQVLHAMGLDCKLAPLVLLAGHGSQSSNNTHAAALDCGACCSQTGKVNARNLAQLLNEAAVRQGLQSQGISIPEETTFVTALYNTTTDEIEGFDLDLLSPATRAHWHRFLGVFTRACDQVHRERVPKLGLDPLAAHGDLLYQLRRRANDGERWVHEPLRLTVVIDAPRQSIEAVIHKHAVVQQFLNNGWLYLWRFDQAGLLQYEPGAWRPVVLEPI